jgi:hypothetical protein
MKLSIFNPFTRIAGLTSLTIGLAAILATTLIGYFSHIHFPDMISVKLSGNLSISIVLLENLSNWLVPSILFYLAIVIFSKPVRVLDVFGTVAMARIPFLIAALTGFFPAQLKFASYVMWKFAKMGTPVEISGFEIATAIIIGIVTILVIIWSIALLFNAFKTISNLNNSKLVAVFIPTLILSIVISMTLFFVLFGDFIAQEINSLT